MPSLSSIPKSWVADPLQHSIGRCNFHAYNRLNFSAMPRQSKPGELTLQAKNVPETSATLQGVDLGSLGGGFEHDIAAGLTPLPTKQPTQLQSPPTSPRPIHSSNRDTSRSFLSSFKSRPAQGDQEKDSRQSKQKEEEYRPNTSSVSKIYHLRNNPGSTPSLSLVGSDENMRRESADGEYNLGQYGVIQ